MAVDSRQKGARAESALVALLKKDTGLNWKRTPGSGALHEDHLLKGDCYIPGEHNFFAVEVKHYKDSHLTSKVLTDKDPQLLQWWNQAIRQGNQTNKKPLLFFKHDRSKWFVMLDIENASGYEKCKRSFIIQPYDTVVCTYEEFVKNIMGGIKWMK